MAALFLKPISSRQPIEGEFKRESRGSLRILFDRVFFFNLSNVFKYKNSFLNHGGNINDFVVETT